MLIKEKLNSGEGSDGTTQEKRSGGKDESPGRPFVLPITTSANEHLGRAEKAGITKKTSKLRSTGKYVGPVDNGQLQVGQGASACANQLARWNATAKSLGCEAA